MGDRIELPERGRLQGARQCGDYWCIPAVVTALLTYHGVRLKQEDLVLAYCERFRDQGALVEPNGTPVHLDALTPPELLEAARRACLTHANFKHFGEIADELANLPDRGLRFVHIDGIQPENLIAEVAGQLKAGHPVGVSAASGEHTFHIVAAFAAETGALYCYDPASGTEIMLPSETTSFAADILALERSAA